MHNNLLKNITALSCLFLLLLAVSVPVHAKSAKNASSVAANATPHQQSALTAVQSKPENPNQVKPVSAVNVPVMQAAKSKSSGSIFTKYEYSEYQHIQEAEPAYKLQFNYSAYAPTKDAIDYLCNTPPADQEGSVSAAFASLFYHWYLASLKPYAGIGLGAAYIEEGGSLDSSSSFAGNLIMGLDWHLTPNTSLNIGYKAVYLDNINPPNRYKTNIGSQDAFNSDRSDSIIQNLSIGAKISF